MQNQWAKFEILKKNKISQFFTHHHHWKKSYINTETFHTYENLEMGGRGKVQSIKF